MSYSTGLLRSARNDASGDVRKWMEGDTSINQGRHCDRELAKREAIQDKQLEPNRLTAFFKSIFLGSCFRRNDEGGNVRW